MKASESLKREIAAAPKNPGIYQYYDSRGTIIYVGKAKDLKNRVLSYFNGDKGKNGKTRLLVSKISSLKYIICLLYTSDSAD